MDFLDRLIATLTHISVRYFLIAGVTFVLFYVIFRKQLTDRKIQKLFPSWVEHRRDISFSLSTIAIFGVIALMVLHYLAPYTLLIDDFNSRSLWYYAATFLAMFFLHDAYFYWAHRLMHHPRLFKVAHKTHHLSTNPSPWTAYAFHPFEAFIEAGIIAIIAFTIPTHKAIIASFLLFQFVYNVYGHLGFELYPANFHKTKIGRWINTGVAHNLHHKRFHGNYGLYTLIWDRLCGTLREDYEETYQEVTETAKQVSVH